MLFSINTIRRESNTLLFFYLDLFQFFTHVILLEKDDYENSKII
jgi:hypothetical protein